MLWLLLFLAIALALYLYLSIQRSAPRKPYFRATEKLCDPEQYVDRNQARQEWLEQRYPQADKWIHTKLAGVSNRNRSGPSRQEILRTCTPKEELRLIRESDNPVDPNAIAIYRNNGQKLGYLNERLAEEMQEWLRKGEPWHAVLSEITSSDRETLGANITLWRMGRSAPTALHRHTAKAPPRSVPSSQETHR